MIIASRHCKADNSLKVMVRRRQMRQTLFKKSDICCFFGGTCQPSETRGVRRATVKRSVDIPSLFPVKIQLYVLYSYRLTTFI